MKRQILNLAAVALVAGAVTLTGCKKDDTTAPIITLKGNSSVDVDFKGTYTDDGATAEDDRDGDISSKVTSNASSVNTSSAETYTVAYDVADEAGNAATQVTRTVNVVVKGTHMAATYSVVDKVGTTTYPTYSDNITASSTDVNKIFASKFAYYDNGAVYFTLSGANGTTVTMPTQTVVCGNPAASRTFAGSGTISKDGVTMIINYTETTNGSTVSGTETYTKQ